MSGLRSFGSSAVGGPVSDINVPQVGTYYIIGAGIVPANKDIPLSPTGNAILALVELFNEDGVDDLECVGRYSNDQQQIVYGLTTGNASFIRVYRSGTCVHQGNVGGLDSDAELRLSSLLINKDQPLTLNVTFVANPKGSVPDTWGFK